MAAKSMQGSPMAGMAREDRKSGKRKSARKMNRSMKRRSKGRG